MSPKLTVERLRAYKGLEHISDTAAKQVIEAMRVLSVLAFVRYK
jgi:hypothetical protein